ncbi:unnamed protein product [Prorocentrum cordatum]|uniref:Uncharacterized protein n=1 Tax=Prorocentrum cordatum TaxID=2364126 RepID=A0ABN9XXA6_9DINO|nr:unnamed protein product [Polarella glacialis]
MPGGIDGMSGMGGVFMGMALSMRQGLLSDPELMAVFSNPEMVAGMHDITSNPGNNNPVKPFRTRSIQRLWGSSARYGWAVAVACLSSEAQEVAAPVRPRLQGPLSMK